MNKNELFLRAISAGSRRLILINIARHYGITRQQAFDEVTSDKSHDLLEYMTGSTRAGTLVLMQMHGFKK